MTDLGLREGASMMHPVVVTEALVHLERPLLLTPYPDVVARVRAICEAAPLSGYCTLVVDATGVGRPVLDMLRVALKDSKTPILPVMITSGERETQANGMWHVPKRDLVSALAIRIQKRAIAIADGLPHIEALLKELMNFRMKMSLSGHDSYEAWRAGQHDDLVIALALACWAAKRKTAGLQGPLLSH